MCPICPSGPPASVIPRLDATEDGVSRHPRQHLAGDGPQLCHQQFLWWKQADCEHVD